MWKDTTEFLCIAQATRVKSKKHFDKNYLV